MPVVDASDAVRGTKRAGKVARDDAASGGSCTTSEAASLEEPALTGGNWDQRIKALKMEANQIRDDRRKVMRQLKAAQRKNKRLKERARTLSEEDMIHILSMRRNRSASADDRASGSASGSASSGAAPASASSEGVPSRDDEEPPCDGERPHE